MSHVADANFVSEVCDAVRACACACIYWVESRGFARFGGIGTRVKVA